MKRFQSVDDYIEGATQWQPELIKLRKILQRTGLQETVKWGSPCYTANGKNVVGLAAFKSYVGLWFFQGALLTDPDQVLINAQDGKTKAMRQWRFASAGEIKPPLIKYYLREAIHLVEQGIEIKSERNRSVVIPAILQAALNRRRKAKARFQKLSPGRRREYIEYVSEAKRPETQVKRVEKILPMIEAGIGLNDKYRNVLTPSRSSHAPTDHRPDRYRIRWQQTQTHRGIHRSSQLRTTNDVSVARMKSPAGWIEPGQTPDIPRNDARPVRHAARRNTRRPVVVHAGQAIICEPGEWVRYSTPLARRCRVCRDLSAGFFAGTVHRDAE